MYGSGYERGVGAVWEGLEANLAFCGVGGGLAWTAGARCVEGEVGGV